MALDPAVGQDVDDLGQRLRRGLERQEGIAGIEQHRRVASQLVGTESRNVQ